MSDPDTSPLVQYIVRVAYNFWKRANGEYLYHVTYYRNLDSIAQEGLAPAGTNTLSPGYASYAKGKLFLTEAAGVRFWFNRCEDFANHNSDNPYEDGWVPVVLRIPYEGDLNDDDLGTQDARANAYYIQDHIDSEDIEVWNGSAWIPVYDGESIDTSQSFDVEEPEYDEESDYPEDGPIYTFKLDNPLEPSL